MASSWNRSFVEKKRKKTQSFSLVLILDHMEKGKQKSVQNIEKVFIKKNIEKVDQSIKQSFIYNFFRVG